MGSDRGWLDVAGFLEGTLKSSAWADILRHYERHFAEFRDQDIEILEIGVDNGSSLAIWKQYFRRARFIGVDINPACRRFAGERVSIEIGSQDDPEFLHGLTRKYHPTIIIDDGSHLAHHIQLTFESLFQSLPPGGMYVIEDMFFQFMPEPLRRLGHADRTSPDYLFDVLRLQLTERPDPSVNHGMRGYLRNAIEEIAFAPLGVAFIRKKSMPIPVDDRVALAEAYAAKENRAEVWCRLANYIHRHRGPIDRAEAAARKSVAMTPRSAQCQRALADVLRWKGDIVGALAAAEAAAELDAAKWEPWDFLGQLYMTAKDFPKAEDGFRKALALRDQDPAIRQRLQAAIAAQGKQA